MKSDKKTIILAFFIVLKFVLQYFIISPDYNLHRDEFLHIDQARHMEWGYMSVPPVTSWISSIILLLGKNVFWVKFFPALFGVLTLVVVWKTIEELNGKLFALLLGSFAITFSVLLRINMLYQPNSLDILCWTFLLFTVVKFIGTDNKNWLLAASITFAIGFLNKYNITFLIFGLVPATLFTKQRKVFWNPYFIFSTIMAFLFIAPNLYWQYMNDFPVFSHLENLTKTQLVNNTVTPFLKEQILFFYCSIYVIPFAFIGLLFYPPFKKYRILIWTFFFTFSIYVYLRAKGYYTIGLYPVLLAFGAVYIEHLLSGGWKKFVQPILLLSILILFIPSLQFAFPIQSPERLVLKNNKAKKLGLLRWEDGKDHLLQQDFADMLGWEELARKVDIVYNNLNDPLHTIVLCDNYGQAGAINYYSSNENIDAVSFSADYINWFSIENEINNIILIKEISDTDTNRVNDKKLFTTVSLQGKIENKYAREFGTKIYLLKGSKTSINDILSREITDNK